MIRKISFLIVLFILAIGFSTAAPIELHSPLVDDHSLDSAPFAGKIADLNGHGLYGAKVSAEDTSSGKVYLVYTDPKGQFAMDIPYGHDYNFTFEYNGNTVEMKNEHLSSHEWKYIKLEPSFSYEGSHDWNRTEANYTKISSNDYALSRLYMDKIQFFRLFQTYALTDSGINSGEKYINIGSKITETDINDHYLVFNTNNAQMQVYDVENGIFVTRFNDDSITKVKLPERYKVSEYSDLEPKILRAINGNDEIIYLLCGDGEITVDRYELTVVGMDDSTLVCMKNQNNPNFDSFITHLHSEYIGGIIETCSNSEHNPTILPIITNNQYTISNKSVDKSTTTFDIETDGLQKISLVFRINNKDKTLKSITVDGDNPKIVSSIAQAMAIAVTPKTAMFSVGDHDYHYLVLPDNKPRTISVEYGDPIPEPIDETKESHEETVLITEEQKEQANQISNEAENKTPGFGIMLSVFCLMIGLALRKRR